MATQNTIFDIDNKLNDARTAAINAMSCIGVECNLSSVDGVAGTVYPENRASWAEVLNSALVLSLTLNDLVEQLSNELEKE